MQNKKQKESLPVMIAKTTLVIAILTGLGTIIFGGGVVIMKYYSGEVNNRIVKTVNQETGNYYDVLEKKCDGDSRCLSSLEFMKENNYKEADENGRCPEGFYKDKNLLQWCVPIEESYCIDEQDNRRELGEIFSESPTMFMKCNRFGNVSNYHILSCGNEKLAVSEGLGVINRKTPSESFSVGGEGTLGFTWTIDNNEYKTFSGGPGTFFVSCDNEKAAIFYSHFVELVGNNNDYTYNKRFFDGNSIVEISCSYCKEGPDNFVISKFEDSKRLYDFKPLENGKEICQEIKKRYQELEKTITDISDWQTYRNEEFGFEVKYPEDWTVFEKRHAYINIHTNQPGGIVINIFQNSNNNLDDIEDDVKKRDSVYDLREIFVDGTKGIAYNYAGAPKQSPGGTTYIFEKNESIIYMGFDRYEDYETNYTKIRNQILSTFKFIEN